MVLALGIIFLGGSVFAQEEDDDPLKTANDIASEAREEARKKMDSAGESLSPYVKGDDPDKAKDIARDIVYIEDIEKNDGNKDQIKVAKKRIEDNLKPGETYDTIKSKPETQTYRDARGVYEEKDADYRKKNSEYQKSENDKARAESKAALEKLAGDSGNFDTQEFLTVEGASRLNLDSETPSDENLIQRILGYLITISGTFGVLMLIVGGFFMVTSEGDDNRLQKGKSIFLYTILGLVMIFVSYIVVQFVISLLFS